MWKGQSRKWRANIVTYFEFSTLAILDVMARTALDVVILEVGMGGRLDAVNIIERCAVITSVDLDHMEFLGPDRGPLAVKRRASCTGRPVVVSDPMPPQSVVDHARTLMPISGVGVDFNVSGDKQQWLVGRGHTLQWSGLPALRGANQLLNTVSVLAALALYANATGDGAGSAQRLVVELPAVQIIPGQPTLVLTWRTTRIR